MTLLAALAGLLVMGGGVLLAWVLSGEVPNGRRLRPRRRTRRRSRLQTMWNDLPPRRRLMIAVAFILGVGLAFTTGWIIGIFLLPAAAYVIPTLLSPPKSFANIERLDGLEEWIRAVASLLRAGDSLEQAIVRSLRSTPDSIRPEVQRLTRRITARWSASDAIAAFADDLGDDVAGVGDMVAADLILAAKLRSGGVVTMMEAVASDVAEEVRAQRQIEADRAKPRGNARWLTLLVLTLIAILLVSPYGTPYLQTGLGQILLVVYLAAMLATLNWMKSMTRSTPMPRFIGKGGATA